MRDQNSLDNIISIVGPESSGKTTLAQDLSQYFGVNYLEEYARIYLEAQQSTDYSLADVLYMQDQQIISENQFLNNSQAFYIFDTDVFTFKMWLILKYGMSSAVTEQHLNEQCNRKYLLCYPDLDWEEDPLRESPSRSERIHHFDTHLDYLSRNNQSFTIIKGIGMARIQKALSFINS